MKTVLKKISVLIPVIAIAILCGAWTVSDLTTQFYNGEIINGNYVTIFQSYPDTAHYFQGKSDAYAEAYNETQISDETVQQIHDQAVYAQEINLGYVDTFSGYPYVQAYFQGKADAYGEIADFAQ